MARFVRKTRSRKRPTKWCGAVNTITVPNEGNLVVADATELCQPTTAVLDQADPLVGWCRGNISLSRVTTTDTAAAVAWAIVMGRLDPGGSVAPVQTFNPWSGDDLERQDILAMGHIPIPPIVKLPTVADTDAVNHSSVVASIQCKVGRKFHRNTNNLFLWVVSSGLDNSFQVKIAVRTLMKFG